MSFSQGKKDQNSKKKLRRGHIKIEVLEWKYMEYWWLNIFIYLTKKQEYRYQCTFFFKYYSNISLQNMNICTHMAFFVI